MHYYLLIALLSVLTSLEPILDKPVPSARTIERVERTVRFERKGRGGEREREREKISIKACVVTALHRRARKSQQRRREFDDTLRAIRMRMALGIVANVNVLIGRVRQHRAIAA